MSPPSSSSSGGGGNTNSPVHSSNFPPTLPEARNYIDENNNDRNNNNNNNNNNASLGVGTTNGPMSIYQMIMTKPALTSEKYTPEGAYHRPVPFQNNNTAAVTNTTTSSSSKSSNNVNNSADFALDVITRKSLPYFQPWFTTAGPAEVPPDFSWISSSCGGKAAIGVFGGGVMGLLMGVFLGAMSDATPPIQTIGGKDVPQAPMKEQVRVTMRATADKSLYWCKNFAFITGVFGGSECLVEKFRGKHDMWNPVVSGCITGAALQAKQGPQAMAVGCGGFAAFSIVIDSVMGNY